LQDCGVSAFFEILVLIVSSGILVTLVLNARNLAKRWDVISYYLQIFAKDKPSLKERL
jgi:hypothetical protein